MKQGPAFAILVLPIDMKLCPSDAYISKRLFILESIHISQQIKMICAHKLMFNLCNIFLLLFFPLLFPRSDFFPPQHTQICFYFLRNKRFQIVRPPWPLLPQHCIGSHPWKCNRQAAERPDKRTFLLEMGLICMLCRRRGGLRRINPVQYSSHSPHSPLIWGQDCPCTLFGACLCVSVRGSVEDGDGERERAQDAQQRYFRNFRESIILVHSIVTCAFSFPTARHVNAFLNLIRVDLDGYFKEG